MNPKKIKAYFKTECNNDKIKGNVSNKTILMFEKRFSQRNYKASFRISAGGGRTDQLGDDAVYI